MATGVPVLLAGVVSPRRLHRRHGNPELYTKCCRGGPVHDPFRLPQCRVRRTRGSEPIRAYRRGHIETNPSGGHWALTVYDGPQLCGEHGCSGLGTGIGGDIQSLTRRVHQQRVKESNPQVLPWPGLRNRFAATALPSIACPRTATVTGALRAYRRPRADDGNRTRVFSLEDYDSTIELHPH